MLLLTVNIFFRRRFAAAIENPHDYTEATLTRPSRHVKIDF